MRQYFELLQHIRATGVDKSDRTGTGTRSIFGYQNRYNLADGFPLLTTKKLFTRGIILELLWILRGDTNVRWLQERKVKIWDEWADANGDLGPVYGAQWRAWTEYVPKSWPNSADAPGLVLRPRDQIADVIKSIKRNPDSRRHIVTAWNPNDVDKVALPPCHCFFQFYVANGKLSCMLIQRSADIFLGVPFNIASYALLTMMMAQVCGLEPGEFVHTFGDTHLYSNHVEQATLQLTRDFRPLPKMALNPEVKDIDKFELSDFMLTGYNPHPSIEAPVAI